jgi:hypothetical protein
LLVLIFTLTIFLNAILLFSIQPLVGKMLLPLLGGTPAVWNTCQLFFQATLLLGYGYAHLSTRWLSEGHQRVLHGLVLLSPLATLPMALAANASPPVDSTPVLWLLTQLAWIAGLPFLVISTGAPLLQHWFSRSGHPDSQDPYFLYAASNVGSMVGLLAYPIVIEPRLRIVAQSRLWAGGYLVVLVLILGCLQLVRNSSQAISDSEAPSRKDPEDQVSPSWRDRLYWIVASMIPSSLMLGVTTYITTDVASIPLLWVVPLALYLLTFVLAFARRQVYSATTLSRILPYFLLPVAVSSRQMSGWGWVPLHLGVFFLGALACHHALAQRRPAAQHLTGYFFWVSVGGVLGGLFNGLIAPLAFRTILEYPLMLVACSLFRLPLDTGSSPNKRRWDLLAPTFLGAALLLARWVLASASLRGLTAMVVMFAIPAFICFTFSKRPLRFALGYAILTLAASAYVDLTLGELLHVERNFFGVKRVLRLFESPTHVLIHGNTRHGTQSQLQEFRHTPLAYYHPTGPAGQIFLKFQKLGGAQRVGLIGLGTGALLTYARQGDHYVLFEIDPGVVEIAENAKYFQFLPDRKPLYRTVLGDGRLTVKQEPDGSFDTLVLDAFSSDSVPTHLLTREALDLYFQKLTPKGVLLLHVSNRFFSFSRLLASLAEEAHIPLRIGTDTVPPGSPLRKRGKTSSRWAVMTHRKGLLKLLETNPGAVKWTTPTPDPHFKVWSDDFSNVLSLLR